MQGGPLDHLAKLTGREFPSHDAEIRDSNTCFPLCAQNMEMWGIVLSSGVYENGDRTPFRNLRHEDEMKSKNLKNQGLIHCVHARSRSADAAARLNLGSARRADPCYPASPLRVPPLPSSSVSLPSVVKSPRFSPPYPWPGLARFWGVIFWKICKFLLALSLNGPDLLGVC